MNKRVIASSIVCTLLSGPVLADDISRYLCESDEAVGFHIKNGTWSSTDFDKLEFIVDVKNSQFLTVKFRGDERATCTGQKLGYVGENYGYHCDSPNTMFQFNPINLKYIYSHLGGYAVSEPLKSTPASIEIGSCRKL